MRSHAGMHLHKHTETKSDFAVMFHSVESGDCPSSKMTKLFCFVVIASVILGLCATRTAHAASAPADLTAMMTTVCGSSYCSRQRDANGNNIGSYATSTLSCTGKNATLYSVTSNLSAFTTVNCSPSGTGQTCTSGDTNRFMTVVYSSDYSAVKSVNIKDSTQNPPNAIGTVDTSQCATAPSSATSVFLSMSGTVAAVLAAGFVMV